MYDSLTQYVSLKMLSLNKGDNFINDKAVGGGVSDLSIIIVMYLHNLIRA